MRDGRAVVQAVDGESAERAARAHVQRIRRFIDKLAGLNRPRTTLTLSEPP